MKLTALTTLSLGMNVASTSIEEEKFSSFKAKFGRAYASATEEATRRAIFEGNLAKIDALNAAEGAAKFAPYGHLTPFMDQTAEEFRKKLGATAPAPANRTAAVPAPTVLGSQGRSSGRFHAQQKQVKAGGEADGIDVFGYCPGPNCSPMQNQGACGDCWAFASTEVLETVTALYGGGLTRLSPQELVDCYTTGGGQHTTCDSGGQIQWGWDLAKQSGIETLGQYPISSSQSGQAGSCRGQAVSTGYVKSYGDGGSGNEQTMLDNFDNYGPIGVSVDASNWQFYDGGKTNGNPGCSPITSCGTSIDHAVEIIGTYNTTAQYVDGWVIRNHWSTEWGCQLDGEGGYALLAIGNMCGISEYPTMVFTS